MGKAYILVILLCVVLGSLYSSLSAKPQTDVQYNLYAIGLGATWIGGFYAVAGILVGWHFVCCLDSTRTKINAFLIASPTHILSTLVAAYVVPTMLYLATHCTEVWIAVAFFSFFLGIPQVLIDFLLLRWLFGLPVKPRQLGTIWLWKTTTVLVFMFLLFTLPTILTLSEALRLLFTSVCDG